MFIFVLVLLVLVLLEVSCRSPQTVKKSSAGLLWQDDVSYKNWLGGLLYLLYFNIFKHFTSDRTQKHPINTKPVISFLSLKVLLATRSDENEQKSFTGQHETVSFFARPATQKLRHASSMKR